MAEQRQFTITRQDLDSVSAKLGTLAEGLPDQERAGLVEQAEPLRPAL